MSHPSLVDCLVPPGPKKSLALDGSGIRGRQIAALQVSAAHFDHFSPS